MKNDKSSQTPLDNEGLASTSNTKLDAEETEAMQSMQRLENGTGLSVFQSGFDGKLRAIEPISKEETPSTSHINTINLYKDLDPPLGQARLKGEGGFAKVYRSTYKGRNVAVKLFNMQFQQQWADDTPDELTRELNIICRLKHEHIVNCLGVSLTPGEKAIVMEYVDNSLHDLIHKVKRQGRMKLVNIFKTIKSIAKALEFLHQAIVHRDLHPLNVLISREGVVKVADFGISHMMEKSTTFVSDYKGAPAYVAPEVFKERKLSRKSDIYSLGMIAWEMWTLQSPWKQEGYGMVVGSVCEGKRPPIPDDTPGNLRSLITRCWQQDYNQRPDARQVYEECNRFIYELEKANKSQIS